MLLICISYCCLFTNFQVSAPCSPALVQHSLQAQLRVLQAMLHGRTTSLPELQVPLPRGATALQWLQGQKAAQAHHLLQPQVYFSPRQSSAPGTPGAAAAEAASAGAGSVAGVLSQHQSASLISLPGLILPLSQYPLLAANGFIWCCSSIACCLTLPSVMQQVSCQNTLTPCQRAKANGAEWMQCMCIELPALSQTKATHAPGSSKVHLQYTKLTRLGA